MNRPIKFRAWEHNLQEMIEVDDIQFYRGDDIEVDGIKLKPRPRNEQPIMINTRSAWRIADGEDVTLMQFTGLTDKNGKEIYEGDIVIYSWKSWGEWHHNPPQEVGWTKDTGFALGESAFHIGIYPSEKLEVIGNIYENPELINP